MKLYILLVNIYFIKVIISQDKCRIRYYEQLINQSVTAEFDYQLPTSSVSYLKHFSTDDFIDFGTFDFIIVGIGSTGTVIASRLSEISEWTVLALEAGKNETDFSIIPSASIGLRMTEMDWGYGTTPQDNICHGMEDNICAYMTGKALGGTSAKNAMFYGRGNRHDFDQWLGSGNQFWSYKSVLPYFLKSENSQLNGYGDIGYHNVGGMLNVAYPNKISPLFQVFLDANAELGRKKVDYNGRNQIGVAMIQNTAINGSRDSGNRAFLTPAKNRRNIRIVTEALVLKILINPSTKKTAYGVQFILNGKMYKAQVRKEVILSAGVINSPQLLMLSGIGESNHLKEKGIKVVHNLPGVGKNFHDHVWFQGFNFALNYTETTASFQEFVKAYLNGIYNPAAQGVSYVQVQSSVHSDYPDLEYLYSFPTMFSIPLPNVFNFTNATMENYFARIDSQSSISVIISLLHAESVGSVTLNSSCPFDYPIINSNNFADSRDMETLYKGIQDNLRIFNTATFQGYEAKLLKHNLVPCQIFEYLSKDYWYCILKHLATTSFHGAGTCKIGFPDDKQAVVNERLQVYGVKNLRVADGSVMPSTTSSHPCATTYMIGEQVSDMIKIAYKQKITEFK